MKKTSFCLAAAIFATTGLADAKSSSLSFQEQLNKALGPQAKEPVLPEKGARKGKRGEPAPANTQWSIPNDGSARSEPCSMFHHSDGNTLGYMGNFQGDPWAIFFVSGPYVPPSKKQRTVSATLRTDGEADQTVKAIQMPLEGGRAAIAFNIGSLNAALDVMEDTETLSVILNGASVFNSSWTGGHAAREKLRACIAAETGE